MLGLFGENVRVCLHVHVLSIKCNCKLIIICLIHPTVRLVIHFIIEQVMFLYETGMVKTIQAVIVASCGWALG